MFAVISTCAVLTGSLDQATAQTAPATPKPTTPQMPAAPAGRTGQVLSTITDQFVAAKTRTCRGMWKCGGQARRTVRGAAILMLRQNTRWICVPCTSYAGPTTHAADA